MYCCAKYVDLAILILVMNLCNDCVECVVVSLSVKSECWMCIDKSEYCYVF
jgi:hypothetical protein